MIIWYCASHEINIYIYEHLPLILCQYVSVLAQMLYFMHMYICSNSIVVSFSSNLHVLFVAFMLWFHVNIWISSVWIHVDHYACIVLCSSCSSMLINTQSSFCYGSMFISIDGDLHSCHDCILIEEARSWSWFGSRQYTCFCSRDDSFNPYTCKFDPVLALLFSWSMHVQWSCLTLAPFWFVYMS